MEEIKITEKMEKECSTCKKTFNILSFKGVRGETKTCQICRERNKIQDAKRDKEHINELARISSKKPERIEKKKEWVENNYEKVSKKWMEYRQRQINSDIDGYLKKNAEQAQKWRDNNPEKLKIINENKKNSLKINYKIYQQSAGYKNLEFVITQEEYELIVVNPCYYCGEIQEKGFNGIDRKNQTIGYITDNCVSCCKFCNYMKGSLSDNVFVNRVEHILKYNKLIECGNLYPELFSNHNTGSFNTYKNRALKKNIEFSINIEQFNEIINKDCYLCGKKTTELHTNGIDRIDNNVGYNTENIKPCCGECNYMKKNFIINDIFNKFIKINNNFNKKNIVENYITENNKIIVKTNKKTKKQINEEEKLRINKNKEELKQKYNDEEYIKNKCEINARNRKQK